MPCSWPRLHMMSDATEPPRCVWSSARPPSNIVAILLSPRDGSSELGLDERRREIDGVPHQRLVDELRRVVRQVVLVVGEMADRHRRDARVGEPVRVDAAGRRTGLELVPLVQLERARRLEGAAAQLVRRREEHELVAAADAVEVDDAGDMLQLVADLRLVDVVAGADELDLLGGERDQRNVTVEDALTDASNPFDARRVVDRARAAEDGVVVRGDEDAALTGAARVGEDVPLAPAYELAADTQPRAHAVLELVGVVRRDERRRRR